MKTEGKKKKKNKQKPSYFDEQSPEQMNEKMKRLSFVCLFACLVLRAQRLSEMTN